MSRRKHEEEHENHERWLVSYADFITLLFAFFVVMYAISSVNEGKYRVLSNSMVQAFRSETNAQGVAIISPPSVAGAPQQPVVAKKPGSSAAKEDKVKEKYRQKMRSVADDIRRVLDPLVRGGQVRVTEGAHGVSIEINASVLFALGDASLSDEPARALQAVAEVVRQGEFPIIIEGHTDTLPIKTPIFPSNWELSAVRASSVVRLFVASGVDPRRLTAAGYGDQRPIAENDTAEGRARNRRVTILLESNLPDVVPAEPMADPSQDAAALGVPKL